MNYEYVVVADYGNHRYVNFNSDYLVRICIFAFTGEFVNTFGTFGSDIGELNSPIDVCISREGSEVLVADSQNNRISIFSIMGEFKRSILFDGLSDRLNNPVIPTSITQARDSTLYITDSLNNCVIVSDQFGKNVRIIGADLGLQNPASVRIVDSIEIGGNVSSALYIADYANHRIVVCDTFGNFKFLCGSGGTNMGELYSPNCAIVIESLKEIYVMDTFNHRVSVFSAINGAFMRLEFTDILGSESLPISCAYNELQKLLYVSDNDSNCIRIINL